MVICIYLQGHNIGIISPVEDLENSRGRHLDLTLKNPVVGVKIGIGLESWIGSSRGYMYLQLKLENLAGFVKIIRYLLRLGEIKHETVITII